MKIIQINTLSCSKSTGRTTKEMHEYLCSIGIDSLIISSALSKNEEDIGQKTVGSILDMKIHALLSRVFGLEGFFSYRATNKIIKILEEEKPDAVILRVLHSNFVNVNKLLEYLKRNNITTILVLHDFWYFTGHCVYPIQTGCDKYKTGCKQCDQIKMVFPSLIFDTSAFVSRKRMSIFSNWSNLFVIGVSEWVTNCAKSSYIFSNVSSFRTIYNWIDQSVFKYTNITNDTFTIIGVSVTWSAEKGVDAFAELSHKLDDEQLVMVGSITPQKRKIFNQKKTVFIEFTNSVKQLVELYNMADVYISFSKQETFGKTIAEAISCGTPAIVYNTTACPELIKSGCGYIIEPGNIDEAYRYICTIKAEGKNKYVKCCLNESNNYFSKENNIKEYIKLIAQYKYIKNENEFID